MTSNRWNAGLVLVMPRSSPLKLRTSLQQRFTVRQSASMGSEATQNLEKCVENKTNSCAGLTMLIKGLHMNKVGFDTLSNLLVTCS